MARTTTTQVRFDGTPGDFSPADIGGDTRSLIRHDKERAFERLKTELERAFAAPDASFYPLSASDVISRNKT